MQVSYVEILCIIIFTDCLIHIEWSQSISLISADQWRHELQLGNLAAWFYFLTLQKWEINIILLKKQTWLLREKNRKQVDKIRNTKQVEKTKFVLKIAHLKLG